MGTAVSNATKVPQFIGGKWVEAEASEWLPVINPATSETIATVPLCGAAEVAKAVEAAAAAFPAWRRTPPEDRIQPLFKLKHLLEEHIDDLAASSHMRTARPLPKPRRRCAAPSRMSKSPAAFPTLMQGYNLEDVARGIDEIMIRQPLGVVAAITPFNFPGMIPFWFLPYAIACGNTFILKPSERVPLTMQARL